MADTYVHPQDTSINRTTTSGLSPTMKTYYEKKMLEIAKTKFIFQQFGQKKPIPRNEGKTVQFRRWNLFTPNTVTQQLTEAVTPDAQVMSMTAITDTVKQYGAYVYVSDLLDLTALDPVIRDAAELLGEQIGTVIDWVTRDAMLADASTQFAGGKTAKNALTLADSKMTIAESRKAIRTLKKAKARTFSDGTFVQIVDPDIAYDLMNDTLWADLSVHADPKRMVNGEIGTLFGVKYVESTECKVDKQTVLNAVNANTSSSTDFVLKNDPTDEEVAYLSVGGGDIWIAGTKYTLASSGSYTPGTKTVKLSAAVSLSANDVVYTDDAGAPAATTYAAPDVHHSLIFGADSYGVIDVAGSGALKTIVHQAGEAGASDPLNQRGSVGCKVMGYTAKVLNSLWIIDIMCCVS